MLIGLTPSRRRRRLGSPYVLRSSTPTVPGTLIKSQWLLALALFLFICKFQSDVEAEWVGVHSHYMEIIPKQILSANPPAITGGRRSLSLGGLSKGRIVSALPPHYVSVGTSEHPSLKPYLHDSLIKRSLYTAPSPELVKGPALEAAPQSYNESSISPVPALPPDLPRGSGCCKVNMVQKRGVQECYCVYPIKVELFLQNASLTNWSKLLVELASQLGLQDKQIEIANFYVVGNADLNITMNIEPYKGLSFSASEANKMNDSLRYHMIRINPTIAGDYRLLNFTWFKPPALPPAPSMALSPKSSPHLANPVKPSREDNGKNSSLVLILCVCIGILVITIITVAAICFCASSRKKKKKWHEDVAKPQTADTVSVEGSLPRSTITRFIVYEELREATNNFDPAYMLGEGGFGRVYKGVLSDGTAVAIKKLTGGGHQGDKEFLVEVEMLSRLHHRNLVKLVGYYSSRDTLQNLLCYELVPNGSLEAWLHGPQGVNCPLDWDTRMKIALDAARGLAYLHEDSQPCVIHRDFKASNILLENDFHAKVSDFGLAKQAPEGRANYLSTRVMGTFGYVAPEYAMTGHLLVKSDVYSYGVVLLELLTGRKPVDMSQPSGQENLVTWARPILQDKDQLEDLADARLDGKYPKEDFIRVCTIAAACVSPEANQRPTMGEVVQSLKMVQRSNEYQDTTPKAEASRPNLKQSSSTYESDGVSSMFSSGPFSGVCLLDNENISRTAIFSEDLHEGR